MAGTIPREFIDQLLARVDIVDVIDQRLPLTRKGGEYQAKCPFHEEKTPSFTVSPAKQFYHCFGCGAHGTAVGFLMDYGNLSFVEAIEELAAGLSLTVPRRGTPARDAASQAQLEQLLSVVEAANQWFQQQLRSHPQAKRARAYLQRRGLDARTIADFAIGYAPDSADALVATLGHSEAQRAQLLSAGLVAKSPNSAQWYARFRGRVMFPIADHRGRVVAFGGRSLDDGQPKYLNSPETPLFRKRAELYGLARARRAIAAENKSLVVEGYMDALSLAQFGLHNTVATLGTATTPTHLQRLFRLAPEVVFCFDGDRAGRAAAWKALQVALPELHDGRQVSFLFLPDGEDPDTVVRAEGKQAFQRRLDTVQPFADFLFAHLTAQVDMQRTDGKARLVSLAKPLLTTLPPGALRQMLLAELARLSGLPQQQLGVPQADKTPKPRPTRRRPTRLSNMATATSLLLQFPHLAATVAAEVENLTLKGAEVLRKLVRLLQADASYTTARLLEAFRQEAVHAYLETLASHTHSIHREVLSDYFADTIAALLAQQAEQRRLFLLEKSRQSGLAADEKQELLALFNKRAAVRATAAE